MKKVVLFSLFQQIEIRKHVVLFALLLINLSLIAQTTYTTSQTVVAPSTGSVIIECWGGGGGSGGASNSSGDAVGGGGGGGAYSKQTFPVTAGDNLVLTIGAGGTAGSSGGGNGGAGGTTSVAAPFFTSAAGGGGGQGRTSGAGTGGAGGNSGTGFLYRGGNGAAGTIAAINRGGGGGGSAGTGSNGNNAPAGGNGATAVAGGVGGANGGNGGCCGGAAGNAGPSYGGGAGGATVYETCCRAGAAGGPGKIILTFNACSAPTLSSITGATNPCVGSSQVYSTGTTGATTYNWVFPTGWVITSGANTASVTVTVGVGLGDITMTPSNGCSTGPIQTLIGITTCTAAAPQTLAFTMPGTHTWTVPATAGCGTVLLTVQAWGAGGGGGAAASRQTSGGSEACSGAGGGGGGGYTIRSYTVNSGEVYTIVVGSGGAGGVGSNASKAANNGSVGGNSTFNGPATVGPGTLIAYGGNAGGGALINNTSGASHLGDNGAGGAGGGGANGTVSFLGGSGSAGEHSGSCADVSGAGGGGAGSNANGGNGSTVGGCALKTGGIGGSVGGGNGADGQRLNSLAASREIDNGLAGNTVGGGGGGSMIHLNNWPNVWNYGNGGVGGNGRVIISASISTCVLPIKLTEFKGKCGNGKKEFEWTTATEINNDYFTVEQSEDGINFYEITKVNGAGNSSVVNKYTSIVNDDKNYSYYRLKQTDYDGQFAYSDMLYLDCEQEQILGVYPNPAVHEIAIELNSKENVNGEIYNVLGERVKSFTAFSGSNRIEVDIENLPQGIYTIVFYNQETGKPFESKKFVKQ